MSDFGAVYWKEIHENVRWNRQLAGSLVGTFAFGFLFGVYFPFQVRSYWPSLFIGAFAAMFLWQTTVVGMTADLFAGEKERHTWRTLNATPLSASGIVYGKLAAVATIALGTSVAAGLCIITTVCALYGRWDGWFVGLGALFGVLPFAAFVGPILVGLAAVMSIRASTMQQAARNMVFLMFPVFILFGGAALAMASIARFVPTSALPLAMLGAVFGFGLLVLGLDALMLWAPVAYYRKKRSAVE